MQQVEKMLNDKKIEIDKIEVPIELEERLAQVLKDKSIVKRSRNNWMTKAVAACLIVIFIGYNFDTLAFYGKRFMGYDTIMNGTLKQLNDLGKGQVIGKNYTFKNGTVVRLDGVMIDANQLLAFYSVKHPSIEVNPSGIPTYLSIHNLSIHGTWRTYAEKGGQGHIAHENEEVKWLSSFEAPVFYEKTLNLKLNLIDNGAVEEGQISFKLDRNKAMGHNLKKTINQTLKESQTQVRFKSITASPTRTVISGSVQNIFELVKDQLSGERIRPENIEIKLIANGKEIAWQGGEMTTDFKGITFHKAFDTLPSELKSLEIYVESFSADHDVNENIKLNLEDKNKSMHIQGQAIQIDKVYESKDSTFITITTGESTILTRVYLGIDDNKIELKETIESNLIKQEDGTILHTRTLHFPKTGKNYQLIIERMTYAELYNKIIEIPIH